MSNRKGKRKATPVEEERDRVKHLIEQCMGHNLKPNEIVDVLYKQHKIERSLTKTVWEALEKQNKGFFDSYYSRLVMKEQNTKQAEILNHLKYTNTVTSPLGSSGSSIPPMHHMQHHVPTAFLNQSEYKNTVTSQLGSSGSSIPPIHQMQHPVPRAFLKHSEYTNTVTSQLGSSGSSIPPMHQMQHPVPTAFLNHSWYTNTVISPLGSSGSSIPPMHQMRHPVPAAFLNHSQYTNTVTSPLGSSGSSIPPMHQMRHPVPTAFLNHSQYTNTVTSPLGSSGSSILPRSMVSHSQIPGRSNSTEKRLTTDASRHYKFVNSDHGASSLPVNMSTVEAGQKKDKQRVKDLIKQSLVYCTTQKQVIQFLYLTEEIGPAFTIAAWTELEREDKEFFKNYYMKDLVVKRQSGKMNQLNPNIKRGPTAALETEHHRVGTLGLQQQAPPHQRSSSAPTVTDNQQFGSSSAPTTTDNQQFGSSSAPTTTDDQQFGSSSGYCRYKSTK
ncbi:hypothetical protein SSX86_019647 [Deinandra increscens subsp. villosa]|uniref:Uncharacterized protein n=1 Tax=Deinandra increscens subsp. villosa TaxID=3103831 RepID=A0AAP0GUS0_9ASTR